MSTKHLSICLAYSLTARTVVEQQVVLPVGSTVQDAIAQLDLSDAQIQALFSHDDGGICCGIWGKKAQPDSPLQDGDRVELYRALVVDPKAARRLRFARQGSRAAGLFARARGKK